MLRAAASSRRCQWASWRAARPHRRDGGDGSPAASALVPSLTHDPCTAARDRHLAGGHGEDERARELRLAMVTRELRPAMVARDLRPSWPHRTSARHGRAGPQPRHGADDLRRRPEPSAAGPRRRSVAPAGPPPAMAPRELRLAMALTSDDQTSPWPCR